MFSYILELHCSVNIWNNGSIHLNNNSYIKNVWNDPHRQKHFNYNDTISKSIQTIMSILIRLKETLCCVIGKEENKILR